MATSEDNATAVHQLARDIAAHMPHGWAYDEKQGRNADGELHWCAYITDPSTGHSVQVDRRYYGSDAQRKRVTFRANLPRYTAKREHIPADDCPSIGCSVDKGPKALAADIVRRLLPSLAAAHRAQSDRLAKHDAHDAAEYSTAQALCQAGYLCKREVEADRDRYLQGLPENASGTARVSGDSCSLDLRSLTVAQALAVLNALSEVKP